MLIIDDIIGFSEILGHESSIFKNKKNKIIAKKITSTFDISLDYSLGFNSFLIS